MRMKVSLNSLSFLPNFVPFLRKMVTVFPRFSALGRLLIQTVLGGGGAYTRGALI